MMSTIHLQPSLMQQIEQAAAEQTVQPEELVETAVRTYLRQLDRDRIKAEAHAYQAMHAQLVQTHLHRCVAIHNGELVDSDADFEALHARIRQRFGRQPVLIRRVEPQPERILTFRSPHLESR